MKIRFLIALLVASADRLIDEWREIKKAMAVNPEVTEDLAQKRLAKCPNCPVYFSLLKTCGSPLRRKGPMVGTGCYCYMPVKARAFADCWAFENGMTFGWPRELNSSIIAMT